MQTGKAAKPVIPARVMARFVGQNDCWMANVPLGGMPRGMTPAALRAVGELVENYLDGILTDAVLSAIHGRRRVIQPMDVQFSLRLRGDRF
jgi:histone H3/H4